MENILEYLVPLIFIVSILSMRKKKKKKTKKEQGTEQPEQIKASSGGGVFGKLNKMLEEYLEADLKDAPEKKPRGDSPTDPFELQQPIREPEPWEDEDDVQEQAVAHPRVIEPVVIPEKIVNADVEPEAAHRPEPVKAPAVKPVTIALEPVPPGLEDVVEASSTVQLSDMTKSDLRKAIVWSEILAPPKALRNE